MTNERCYAVDTSFSLATTCGPAAWASERSSRQRWTDGTLTWVSHEDDQVVWRQVSQPEPDTVVIRGTADPAGDGDWLRSILGVDTTLPAFGDPVIQRLAERYPGLRPMGDGGLFAGLVCCIIGQSISVAAAATVQSRLCAVFSSGIQVDGHTYRPLPTAVQLADASPDLIRTCGVTWKRAAAIVAAAQQQAAGALPDDAWALANPTEAVRQLLDLPGVGRWTAESAVLWGLGAPDAHPVNDVALLRAARIAYGQPELSLRDLDRLAEQWRPARALAARLLWTNMLGPAPA